MLVSYSTAPSKIYGRLGFGVYSFALKKHLLSCSLRKLCQLLKNTLFNNTTSSALAIQLASVNIKGGTNQVCNHQCLVSLEKNLECIYQSSRYDTRLVRDIDESALFYVGLFHENSDPGILQLTGICPIIAIERYDTGHFGDPHSFGVTV